MSRDHRNKDKRLSYEVTQHDYMYVENHDFFSPFLVVFFGRLPLWFQHGLKPIYTVNNELCTNE